jgi:hypothetical protein
MTVDNDARRPGAFQEMRGSFAAPHLPAPPAPRGGGSGAPANALAWTQSAFYLATGLWPVASLRTFEAVTGPKTDGWLVRTVGGLITVAGAALGSAAATRRVTPEVALVGAGCAATLAAIDLVYVSRKRIPPIYLADAVVELGLVAAWALAAGSLDGGRGRDRAD